MDKQVFVKPTDKEQRIEFVEYLEAHGYNCEESKVLTRAVILESRFPIIVQVKDMTYSVLGNTTCAAGAASCNKIISVEEFLKPYKDLVE